jgi:3alpha(or 20beta)-hydroxysteroid dehydrogenase
MMFSLKGKTAVITGASQGIGLASAKRFAEAGATVVIADIQDCSAVAEELGGHFQKTDVSDYQQVHALMAFAKQKTGRLDILFNNAGIATPLEPISDVDPAQIERALKINLNGVIHGLKAAAEFMDDHGAIINTSSLAGKLGVYGYTSYGVSKFGVLGATQTAAIEFGPRGIRVNALCPASVNTPMAAENDQSQLDMEKVMIPLGRICEPEEVAAVAHFLASDDCRFISGQSINLCGGMTAGISIGAWEAAANRVGD